MSERARPPEVDVGVERLAQRRARPEAQARVRTQFNEVRSLRRGPTRNMKLALVLSTLWKVVPINIAPHIAPDRCHDALNYSDEKICFLNIILQTT